MKYLLILILTGCASAEPLPKEPDSPWPKQQKPVYNYGWA